MQRFLVLFSAVSNQFRPRRHRLTASTYRQFRTQAHAPDHPDRVGGCGKTRLALEVARRSATQFDDGVALVELPSLTDGSVVAQAIGSTLGIREAPTQPLLATLGGVLKPRHLLLVLDNCEHLLDACAHVADALLRVCPGLTILATSREALGLIGEASWRVPSLPDRRCTRYRRWSNWPSSRPYGCSPSAPTRPIRRSV